MKQKTDDWFCLAMLIINQTIPKATEESAVQTAWAEQRVSQLINKLLTKHASQRPCAHGVELIPVQRDADTTHIQVNVRISLDKVNMTNGTQREAAARTTSTVFL
jgi:hypothetical protein